jgi:hypothetical protein
MQRVSARSGSIALAVLCAVGLLAAWAGCSNDEATTPTCVNDVSDQGVAVDDAGAHVDGGCNPYPTCRDAQGNALPPQSCCIGPDAGKNAAPTQDQVMCLCSYGVGHCDNLGTGGAGGTATTTSTTSTGAGGAKGQGGSAGGATK